MASHSVDDGLVIDLFSDNDVTLVTRAPRWCACSGAKPGEFDKKRTHDTGFAPGPQGIIATTGAAV